MQVPLNARWKAQIAGRHVLMDAGGQQRGTFQRTGKTLRDGKATVAGQKFEIRQRGAGNFRQITAASPDGYELASLRVNTLLWNGTVFGPGFGEMNVRRKFGLTSMFSFGDPQVISAQRKGRATEVYFLPDVPERAPVLLVLGLVLVHTHRRATT